MKVQSLPTCIPCLLKYSRGFFGEASFCSLVLGQGKQNRGCSSLPKHLPASSGCGGSLSSKTEWEKNTSGCFSNINAFPTAEHFTDCYRKRVREGFGDKIKHNNYSYFIIYINISVDENLWSCSHRCMSLYSSVINNCCVCILHPNVSNMLLKN